MSRFPQSPATRGSQKWIQKVINQRPDVLDRLLLQHLSHASAVEWCSPLASDDFAEYRDGAFLERLKIGELAGALAEFWPNSDMKGPATAGE